MATVRKERPYRFLWNKKMQLTGLEPARGCPTEPKSAASANSAIAAWKYDIKYSPYAANPKALRLRAGSQRMSSVLSAHGLIKRIKLRNDPCRQARERPAKSALCLSLAVAAFAVCSQSESPPLESRLSADVFRIVCAWLIATRKMRRRKKLCRRRKKEKENKKKVRHGGLEPPTT